MSELSRLRVEIQARKFRLQEIGSEIDRRIRDIKDALAGHPLTKPDHLRLANVAELSREMECLQTEYFAIKAEIELAEKELHG